MITKTLTVQGKSGLHARPAAQFVKLCSPFKSSIQLEYQGKKLNAKSIMEMMMAAIPQGGSFTLTVDGPDENEVIATLEKALLEGVLD